MDAYTGNGPTQLMDDVDEALDLVRLAKRANIKLSQLVIVESLGYGDVLRSYTTKEKTKWSPR